MIQKIEVPKGCESFLDRNGVVCYLDRIAYGGIKGGVVVIYGGYPGAIWLKSDGTKQQCAVLAGQSGDLAWGGGYKLND